MAMPEDRIKEKAREVIQLALANRKLVAEEALQAMAGLELADAERIIKSCPATIVTAVDVPRQATRQYEILMAVTDADIAVPAGAAGAAGSAKQSYFTTKYEKMRRLIEERIGKNYVSIANLPYRDEAHVIAMVRDIKKDTVSVELEDPTKTTTALFESAEQLAGLALDDTVAVRLTTAGPQVFGKEIIFPGVPLRQPAKGSGTGCFISDLHLNEAPKSDIDALFRWLQELRCDRLFIAGDVGDMRLLEQNLPAVQTFLIPGEADSRDYPQLPLNAARANTIPLSNPAMVRVGGLNILLVHKFTTDMLKKRHLGEPTLPLTRDVLALEHVPDIVHYGHTHEPFVSNNKSITLVNSGSLLADFRPVILDFETREWKEVRPWK